MGTTQDVIKVADVRRAPPCHVHGMVDMTGTLVFALVVAALIFMFAPRPS